MVKTLRRFTAIIVISLLLSHSVQGQCTVDFTYSSTSNNLYTFTNTSSPLDTSANITWSIIGKNIVYRSLDKEASFYLPVNGTYYIMLEVTGNIACGGYKRDSIVISELTLTGDCQAAFNYYPTTSAQFQMIDASDASDSIVNYTWHGHTIDTFFQVNGYEKNSVLSLWSYNFCTYGYYIVNHSITTITGCQSTVSERVSAYCDCLAERQLTIQTHYDAAANAYYYSDSTTTGQTDMWYWIANTGDSSYVSTDSILYLPATQDSFTVVCLNAYDTLTHCSAFICDTFYTLISGATELSSGNRIIVYPNPATDVLHIRNSIDTDEEFIATIFNSLGEKVFEQKCRGIDLSLPISSLLPGGLYLLQLQKRLGMLSNKFLKL